MAVVRGCHFPDEFHYDVKHHVWYREAEQGVIKAGITTVGVALAREVIVFSTKRPGAEFEQGRAFATLESAKWIGSVRSAFDGKVIAVNEEAKRNPELVNSDCYGTGWLLEVCPAAENWQKNLVTGDAIAAAYEAWMENEAYPGCG